MNSSSKKVFLALLISLFSFSFFLANKDSTEVEGLIMKARSFFNKDPLKGKTFALLALETARQMNHNNLISKSLNALGSCHYYLGNNDSSLYFHNEALNIQLKTNDSIGIGRSYTNIGLFYIDRGENKRALFYLIKSEKIFLNTGFYEGLAKVYNNLGVLFYNIRDFNHSLYNYQKCFDLALRRNDSLLMYSSLSNIASCYDGRGEVKMAIKNYERAKDIAIKMGNSVDVVALINNIVPMRIDEGYFELALELNNNAIKICSDKQIDNSFKVTIYENFSKLYLHQNKLDLANKYVDSSINLAARISAQGKLPELYSLKIKCLSAGGLNSSVSKYVESLVRLKDSLYEEQINSQINEINTKYEVSKKENQIKNFKLEKTYQEKVKTLLYIIIFTIAILLLFYIYNFRQKSIDNKFINYQKSELQKANELLSSKQKEILDSINYAKRIQDALFVNKDLIDKYLPNNCLYFLPKDIVSGDFYWASKIEDNFFLAVCDSTGHGVPGAFMSLLNISFLNEAVKEKRIFEPNKIFDFVRNRLIENISKDGQKDGFDGIVICIDNLNGKITYAAANNSPVLVRDNSVIELGCDRMPVGLGEKKENFELYDIEYKSGDSLYLYTDGFADQFGGPKGKKFKYKKLNEFLSSISIKCPNEQEKLLSMCFDNWKGDLEQIDDVCVFGIKF